MGIYDCQDRKKITCKDRESEPSCQTLVCEPKKDKVDNCSRLNDEKTN